MGDYSDGKYCDEARINTDECSDEEWIIEPKMEEEEPCEMERSLETQPSCLEER
jgi:hypothetical protein